jgi:hypothetical protein
MMRGSTRTVCATTHIAAGRGPVLRRLQQAMPSYAALYGTAQNSMRPAGTLQGLTPSSAL